MGSIARLVYCTYTAQSRRGRLPSCNVLRFSGAGDRRADDMTRGMTFPVETHA